MSRWAPVLEVAKVVIAVFVSAILIRAFIFQPFVVDGSSMEPNFRHGDYLAVEKVKYRLGDPQRGDVVVLKFPNNESINYIKRLIGMPGETLRIEDGKVYINGKVLNEKYLVPNEQTVVSRNPEVPYEITLSDEQYFVMGDNRNHSSDSRDGWLLTRDQIVGRSALILYPRQDFKAIASPQY